MAHFAQLDENNKVLQVIVVNNQDILDENGVENETIGIAFCQSLLGSDTRWVQTSYNNSFRRQYASINCTYDENLDVFIERQPFPSWTLDSNGYWQPPVPKPTPPEKYLALWDEEDQEWFFVLNAEEI
jgi:hypothetical protein